MSDEFVSATPEVRRDWRGRPYIKQPDGSEITYTRCTTYIDVLSDKTQLTKWQQRMVALGLSERPDLQLAVLAHAEDKKELGKIVDQAREAAAASAKATIGTALHSFSEKVDRRERLSRNLPPATAASIKAYRDAMKPFKVLHIEQFLVQDKYKVGGTADRIIEYKGERYIADTKSGNIDIDPLKIAMQLAMYAHSAMYDIATGERTYHGASCNRGLIIHLPQVEDPKDAKCDLWWIDLEAGWAAVQLAKQVHDARRQTFKQLTAAFDGKPDRPSLYAEKQVEARSEAELQLLRESLERQINACDDPELIRHLWAMNESAWTDALTETAKKRIQGLPAA